MEGGRKGEGEAKRDKERKLQTKKIGSKRGTERN